MIGLHKKYLNFYKKKFNLISHKTNIESGGLYEDWYFDWDGF